MNVVVSILLSFSVVTLFTQNLFACSPAGPDPWFAIHLSLDQSTLPNGVQILQTDSTNESFELINNDTEPFYLVREISPVLLLPAYGNEYRFPDSGLPEGYEPRYKITSQQVFFWGQQSSQDTKKWMPNQDGTNNSTKASVKIGADIYILDEESRQIYQDNRPAGVAIPAPQNFKISGFHRGRPVEIKGTLSYSLNEAYDPHRLANGAEECDRLVKSLNNPLSGILSFTPLIVTLGVLSGLGFLVYKIIKRSKK